MLSTKLKKELLIATFQVITLFILIFMFYILYKSNIIEITDNVFLSDLIGNWEKKGIKEIYIANDVEKCESEFFSREWEGTEPACDCRNSYHYGIKSDIFKGKCSIIQIMVGCTEIGAIQKILTKKWKGSRICVKNYEYNYFDSVTVIGEKCPKKFILCGTDTKNFNLCFPKKHGGCPVNKILIKNSQSIDKKIYHTVKINDDWFLHYSKNFQNNTLPIDIKYSEGRICINPSEINLKNGYLKFKKFHNKETDTSLPTLPITSCSIKIGKFNFDERYKMIDSISKFKFYSDNNIMSKLEHLPQLNSQDLINYNSQLHERSYIHWSPYCRADAELSPEAFIQNLIQLSKIDGFYDFLFKYFIFIVFFYIGQSIFTLFISKKFNYVLECICFTLIISFILSVFVLIFILNNNSFLIKKFISQKCGDYITNMTFYEIGKNLNNLTMNTYQVVLSSMVLLIVLIANKLIENL